MNRVAAHPHRSPWHAGCGLPGDTSHRDGDCMPPSDKSLGLMLELGDPAAPRNRSERLEQAMRVAMAMMDADAVVVRAPSSKSGKRTALHARSVGTSML